MPLLGRDFDERKALIRGLINALIRNESIETTEAKAKAIKGHIDQLISQAKKSTLHATRLIESFLIDRDNTEKLVRTIAPSLKSRSGGYVKITRIGVRKGDNAMIVRMQFSDKPEKKSIPPKGETKKTIASKAIKSSSPKKISKVSPKPNK